MTSAFIAITILKQSSMPEKQLSIFLFYLSQEALREYLFNADIYKGRNRMSKNEFVEMIITGKPKLLNILTEKKNYQKKTLLNYLKNNMLIDFKKH